MTRAATDGARPYRAVVIGLHVAAGLYHQFICKDETLLRMM
jgi:cytochrome b561